MKLVTFRYNYERPRLGAIETDSVIDLNAAAAAVLEAEGDACGREIAEALIGADLARFLAGGGRSAELARRALDHAVDMSASHPGGLTRIPLAEVELLPPVPNPPKIICVARNFVAHAQEAGRPLPEIPIVFGRFPSTLLGHRAPIVRPTVSAELDWEGELAVIIGRGGGHISREDAMSHVGGYSIFNDVTVRDFQFRTTQYVAGKNFRASGPFGPYLTTADEVDPSGLTITTTVNGESVQTGNTKDMIFDIPTIIEHISEWIDLEPGDLIPMGTPSGVGFSRTPPWFLQPGDTVAVEITGLGVLENPVIAEEASEA